MASIFDVAKYILKKQGSMTTMKLQKLCYYAQAWSLVWDEEPLFEDDFEAWSNGPVCRNLFNEHKGMFTISSISKGNEEKLTSSQIETIDTVLEFYGKKEPHWLSAQTHNEKPWTNAREGVSSGENCERIISKQDMIDYYGNLQ